MSSLSFYSIVGLLGLVVLRWVWQRFHRISVAVVPGPEPRSFLMGNLQDVFQDEVGAAEFRWLEEFGPTIRFRGALGEDRLMIMDPKAIQYILQTTRYHFAKSYDRLFMIKMLIGKGVAGMDGEDHIRQRRILLPAFGGPESKALMPLFRRCAQMLVSQWKDAIVSRGDGSAVFNIIGEIQRATMDAIGEAAFDYYFGALEQKENALAKSFTTLIVEGVGLPTASKIFVQRGLSALLPVPLLHVMQALTSYSKGAQIIQKHNKLCDDIAKELVDGKKTKGGKDVLSLIVKANMSQNEKNGMSDEELLGQFKTIMGAGHETTANTLTWLLLELSKKPEAQTKLRAEIDEVKVKAQGRGDSEPTLTDLENLPYFNAVIKETLRMHTVVPHLFRTPDRDDVIPLSTPITTKSGKVITEIPVPKGIQVQISAAGFNRVKEIWGQDAQEFRPERWLDGTIQKADAAVGVLGNMMSFGSGARSCIGWRFAIVEMQTFLYELVGSFEFALTEDAKRVKRQPTVVMLPMVEGLQGRDSAILPLKVSLLDSEY